MLSLIFGKCSNLPCLSKRKPDIDRSRHTLDLSEEMSNDTELEENSTRFELKGIPRIHVSPSSSSSLSEPESPWSILPLVLQPVQSLPQRGLVSIPLPSLSPFPRRGHSTVSIYPSKQELILFGGIVEDTPQNDVYIISAYDGKTRLVETSGDIPSPRFGHTSGVAVGKILTVWGGNLGKEGVSESKLDNSLYLLNLVSHEWSHPATSASPPARYNHASCIFGVKFYIFGGQAGSRFLNDGWSFDLNTLRTDPKWELVEPVESSLLPPVRAGHICVSHGSNIIMFGGNDDQYYYSDTWIFDTVTRTWTEMQVTGFLPSPRTHSAATIVDDVMYVFGGTGCDGETPTDLAALNLFQKRWYTFQDIGPAPSARSGHTVTSVGTQVLVLGGREEGTSTGNLDVNSIHTLDTSLIRYPRRKMPRLYVDTNVYRPTAS